MIIESPRSVLSIVVVKKAMVLWYKQVLIIGGHKNECNRDYKKH